MRTNEPRITLCCSFILTNEFLVLTVPVSLVKTQPKRDAANKVLDAYKCRYCHGEQTTFDTRTLTRSSAGKSTGRRNKSQGTFLDIHLSPLAATWQRRLSSVPTYRTCMPLAIRRPRLFCWAFTSTTSLKRLQPMII